LPTLTQTPYNQIGPQLSSQTPHWDAVARVPYLTNNAGTPSFRSYDDERSVTEKINYAKQRGLGGWSIWHLALDYFQDRTPQNPLLAAVEKAMATAPSITSASTMPPGTIGIWYQRALTASGTPPLTWAVVSGLVPPGLVLAPSTGIITGAPTTGGTFPFTVQVSNVAGAATLQESISVAGVRRQ
jgi:hypothetical protein